MRSFEDISSLKRNEKLLVEKTSGVLVLSMVLSFILSSFLQNLIWGAAGLIEPSYLPGRLFKEVSALISYSLSLVVPFSFAGAVMGVSFRDIFKKKRVPVSLSAKATFISLGVMSLGMFASFALGKIINLAGIGFIKGEPSFPDSGPAFIVYLLNLTIVPALFEEIAFRGFILSCLRRFGDFFALFVSSFMFALLHLTPDRFPHSFIAGLILGYFVIFTGSLRLGIKVHFIYNLILTLTSFLSFKFKESILMITFASQGIILFMAIISIFMFINKYPNAFSLRKARTYNKEGENIRNFLLSKGMLLYYVFAFFMMMNSVVIV